MELEIEHDYPLAIKTKVEGANIVIIPLKTEGVSLEIIDGIISCSYGVNQSLPMMILGLRLQVS